MYTVLRDNQTAVASCDDLNAAIKLVQSLESGLDRRREHSPYTIIRTEDLVSIANRNY